MAVVVTLSMGYDLAYVWRQVGADVGEDAAGNSTRTRNARLAAIQR